MEDCWLNQDDNSIIGTSVDCLKCKRMSLGEYMADENRDPKVDLFLKGYVRLLLELAYYLKGITPEQRATIRSLERRFKCQVERGVTIEQLLSSLDVVETWLAKDKAEQDRLREDKLRGK